MFEAIANFIYNWQTLIAGLVALIGARITILAVREQIDASREAFEKTLANEEYSSRALLPHTLDEIAGYAEKLIKILNDVDVTSRSNRMAACQQVMAIEVLGKKYILQNLSNATKAVGGDKRVELIDLIAFLQVHDARLRSYIDRVKKGELSELMSMPRLLDAAHLYAITTSLMEWARRSEGRNLGSYVANDIRLALFVNLSGTFTPQIEEQLAAMEERERRR